MRRTIAPTVLLCSLVALVACGTPQERCARAGSGELRTLNRLIAETERNIARGYTYTTEVRDVSFGWEYCGGWNGNVYLCADNDTETYRRPVAIDPELEQRKLAGLKAKQAEIYQRLQVQAMECRARYPS
jgi:hypothetical protein